MNFLTKAVNLIAISLLGMASAAADTANFVASKDNSISENDQANSFAVSPGIFAGVTGGSTSNTIRRGLLAFDLSSIPAGSTINNVILTLKLTQSGTGGTSTNSVDLHVINTDWGEGTSGSGSNNSGGGNGTPATTNDATWISAMHPSTAWGNVGGDFNPTSSATQTITAAIDYNWSSATMIADVKDWVDNGNNYGWMLIGDENIATAPSAKRFASKENNALINTLPNLFVEYTLPAPPATSAAPLIGLPGLIALVIGFLTSGFVLIRRYK